MVGPLDGFKIEFTCEGCGRKVKKTVAGIKANQNFACRCGVLFKASVIRAKLLEAERKLVGFGRSLKKPDH